MNLAKAPPSWMDKSFFEKVVRQFEKDPQAQLQDFKITAGSKPGDNFSSAVFRGAITFKSKYTKGEAKTISTFIKVQPQFPPEFQHMQNSALFKTEMEMFAKILPEIESLWASSGEKETLCPT